MKSKISTNQSPSEISVLDMQGKMLMRQTITTHASNNNIRVDVSSLSGGIYILQISNNDGVKIEKLVKQ